MVQRLCGNFSQVVCECVMLVFSFTCSLFFLFGFFFQFLLPMRRFDDHLCIPFIIYLLLLISIFPFRIRPCFGLMMTTYVNTTEFWIEIFLIPLHALRVISDQRFGIDLLFYISYYGWIWMNQLTPQFFGSADCGR